MDGTDNNFMTEKRIWLSIAQPGGREQEFVASAFDSNWITAGGPSVEAFEKELKVYLRTPKEVVALNSGTSAIHLALIQMGVVPGDEVVCQSLTFAASANPVKYLGASPVFVDSEADTWNMSPVYLEKAIIDRLHITGKKPKAIIFVDLYGMPAKINEILDIASKYEIPALEDSAEALGSKYKGRYCGDFGAYGVLSFNGNKIITTSAGGALICPTLEDAHKARYLSTQAKDPAPHYQHSSIGYNYRMSNICAAIGQGQMLVLDKYVERRRNIHQLYKNELKTIPELVYQEESPENISNYWLTSVLFPTYELREKVRLALDAENIESRPIWKPMHLQPVFFSSPFYGELISDNLFNRGLCLPSGSGLEDEDIIRICKIIKSTIV